MLICTLILNRLRGRRLERGYCALIKLGRLGMLGSKGLKQLITVFLRNWYGRCWCRQRSWARVHYLGQRRYRHWGTFLGRAERFIDRDGLS